VILNRSLQIAQSTPNSAKEDGKFRALGGPSEKTGDAGAKAQ